MDPGWNPQGTILGLEKVPFISTFWVRFVKYESNQETETLLSPKVEDYLIIKNVSQWQRPSVDLS